MKKYLLAIVVLFAGTSYAQRSSGDGSSPVFNLRMKGENEELAEGYAKAFSSLRSVPVHVLIGREGGEPTVIADIKRVSASGAVLVLETGRGLVYVVRPKDILWFSDAAPNKVVSTKP
ncbi:MAG TPA: hypothetical protein VGD81_13560 [Opitutaceae bacterium]